MEEGIDVDKIMDELGFVKELDSIGEGYTKEIRLCNSNCIGCEYSICFGIRKAIPKDVQEAGDWIDLVDWHCYGVLYKPLSTDAEDEPWSRLFILNTERGNLETAVYDCAHTMARVMTAMDFRQISGTEFIDLSNSSRGSMLKDFKDWSHMHLYYKFNPSNRNAIAEFENKSETS